MANCSLRLAIANSLNISIFDIYKEVKDIKHDVVELKNGKKYQLILKEI